MTNLEALQQIHAITTAALAAPPSSATPIYVPAGGPLQHVLDAAPQDARVQLEAGATYPGQFVHPGRGISLSTRDAVPVGRATAQDSVATLVSLTKGPALRVKPGAVGGLCASVALKSTDPTSEVCVIGDPLATQASHQPRDFTLDRLVILGDPAKGQKRGVALHGVNLALLNSHIGDIKFPQQDTQAVYILNGPGPYFVRNNLLEGAGENLMSGGDTARILGCIPSDILIEGNTITKPLAWRGQAWQVKNLLEFKSARRVTVRGNDIGYCWHAAQDGYAILISPRNQNGDAPYTVVEDIDIEYNVIHDVANVIKITGDDDTHPSQRTRRIGIRHNLAIASYQQYGKDNGYGRFLHLGRAPQGITVQHNTAITDGYTCVYSSPGGSVKESPGSTWIGNALYHRRYGFKCEGGTFASYYPGAEFAGNVIAGGTGYPSGNWTPAVAEFEAGFVDLAGKDYRIKPEVAWAGAGVDLSKVPTW